MIILIWDSPYLSIKNFISKERLKRCAASELPTPFCINKGQWNRSSKGRENNKLWTWIRGKKWSFAKIFPALIRLKKCISHRRSGKCWEKKKKPNKQIKNAKLNFFFRLPLLQIIPLSMLQVSRPIGMMLMSLCVNAHMQNFHHILDSDFSYALNVSHVESNHLWTTTVEDYKLQMRDQPRIIAATATEHISNVSIKSSAWILREHDLTWESWLFSSNRMAMQWNAEQQW